MKTANLKSLIKHQTTAIQIGLLTGGAIIVFQAISLLVTYRYLKLDYYLCLVAVCFLVTGLLLNKRPPQAEISLPEDRPCQPCLPHPSLTIPQETLSNLPASANIPEPIQDLLAILTSKEFLILRMLAEGKTNKEIAAAQFVELSTVKTHVNNIYSKLSVNNRKEARSRYAEMAQRLPFF